MTHIANEPGLPLPAGSALERKVSSRRDMLRSFKETPRPAGVYAIRNQLTGRVFVGASMNVPGSLNRHRFELEQRAHRNRAMQQDWINGGADVFVFQSLEMLKWRNDPGFDHVAELALMLTLWCEECDSFGEEGYNGVSAARRPTAGG